MQSLPFIANIAVIIGAVVSAFTLLIVLVDYYKSHIQTKRSRIEAVPRTGENKITGNAERFTISLKVGFNNEGQRDGFVIPKEVKYIEVRGNGSSSTFTDFNLRNFYLEKSGESRVPPSSNITGTLTIDIEDNTELGKSFSASSETEVSIIFLIEDNEGSYSIEHSDIIDTTRISW
jgi:hypothetical protein